MSEAGWRLHPDITVVHLCLLLACFSWQKQLAQGDNWQENIRPKLFAQLSSKDYQSFAGIPSHQNTADSASASPADKNVSSLLNQQYFTSLLYTNLDQDILVVGARNIIYKLNAEELRLTQFQSWNSAELDRENCIVKGKSLLECQNYIKVLLQFKDDPVRYLICGTNAYKPMCREYVDDRGSYIMRVETPGLGLAPFSHKHNSTAVLVGDHLYAATVADFTGVDPIIFRAPIRTVQYDSTQLNSPDFVGSFESGEHVYFLFREGAVEHTNCGKAIFSRIARVCKNDEGGPHKAKVAWTSYLKARLNCSVPGNFPFYFDEIQSVSELVSGKYGPSVNKVEYDYDQVIYTTFSTPVNSIGGSALCAFRLKEISSVFNGAFKEHRDISSNWMPVPEHKVPSPRPGLCTNDTKSLPDLNLNFIKTHSLMDESVPPFFGAPLLIRTGLVSRFTAVAVDSQVTTTDGKAYDILFIGTTTGRVIKVINALSADSINQVRTVVIEELQVFDHKTVIKDLKVMGSREARKSLGRLAVMTEKEIRSLPVQRCDRASNCQECVALQDPYCAWDVRSSRCGSGDWTSNMASGFLQSITDGRHSYCPNDTEVGAAREHEDALSARSSLTSDIHGTFADPSAEILYAYEHFYGRAPLGQVVNIVDDRILGPNPNGKLGRDSSSNTRTSTNVGSPGPGVQVIESSQVLFSLETLIITVSAGAVAALVVGFVTGYCCGRRCQKDSESGVLAVAYPDTEYEYFEQRGGLTRSTLMSSVPFSGVPSSQISGGPMIATETAKLDNRQEEVTYAEPELVTGLSHPSGPSIGGMLLNSGSDATSNFPNSRYIGAGGSGGGGGSSAHYSSSLLNPSQQSNKFNTIHSSVNKMGMAPGSMFPMSHYESTAGHGPSRVTAAKEHAYGRLGNVTGPLINLTSRESPTGGPPANAYQMSTLGRSSSMRVKEPLMSGSSSSGSAPNSNSSIEHHLVRQPQVVDSAYGTTRSSKKVYL